MPCDNRDSSFSTPDGILFWNGMFSFQHSTWLSIRCWGESWVCLQISLRLNTVQTRAYLKIIVSFNLCSPELIFEIPYFVFLVVCTIDNQEVIGIVFVSNILTHSKVTDDSCRRIWYHFNITANMYLS